MSHGNSATDWIGAILLSAGTFTAAVGLNTIEQILRIVLLIASITSFTFAAILYRKKIKRIENAVKEEMKKKCPPLG